MLLSDLAIIALRVIEAAAYVAGFLAGAAWFRAVVR